MPDNIKSGRIAKRRNRTDQSAQKLPTIPPSAQITKRPLYHPAIPSPYSGSTHQKTIYISSKTPFISAIKRAEKLLHLSDKRLVQSASQLNRDAQNKKRKWGEDEIVGIAREVESAKRKEGGQEEVVLKGSGKAIGKVMELGVWFQEREEYRVRGRTGSVAAVDDVEYREEECDEKERVKEGMEIDGRGGEEKVDMMGASRVVKREERKTEDGKTEVNETRIRQLSVLEVYVSLR